uniref:Uncharacterized protein n=1 Tax=Lotus japonicus TaxID=34305 RepID=I3SK28_LOTJA|nr:unknown [Lotus japonicus]
MDFLKIKKFRKSQKGYGEKDLTDKAVPEPEEPKTNTGGPDQCKSENADPAGDAEDDDDFITNEVKRRLKELRRNSFMVLIPEEDSARRRGRMKRKRGRLARTSGGMWRQKVSSGGVALMLCLKSTVKKCYSSIG